MSDHPAFDEQLLQRLPLPLAQLCRRSLNAQTPLERHNAAFYVWEVALKLCGSVAVVEYANLSDHDPATAELLRSLARPSLGHWWGYVRGLLPILAGHKDVGFASACSLLLGDARDDMPRAAGLHSELIAALEGRTSTRGTVRLTDLIDRVVEYRNREIGHGASGQREAEFYVRMSRALLAGAADVLGRLDVLAGRRLLCLGEVRQQPTGAWLADRFILVGEAPKRLEPLEFAAADTSRLPRQHQVHLELTAGAGRPESTPGLCALHPLVLFENLSDFYFLNARRGERRLEYLCYRSGKTEKRATLRADHRELLARVLGQSVDEQSAEAWASVELAREPDATAEGGPAEPTSSRSIGDFTLLGRLGQGGMGIVYRAWQPSLKREVALKCMLGMGGTVADKRFMREITALGRVDHPNVVKVFTSGTDNDQLYYAMELIEGAELSRVWDQLGGNHTTEIDESHWRKALTTACHEFRAEETRLSDTELKPGRPAPAARAAAARDQGPLGTRAHVTLVVEVIRQVAEATHVLHEAGVIHRDIKPHNIMLTDLNHPVLMDLGLAQLADENEKALTRTRQFVGTLRYASPEQLYASGLVNRRTDIYSLGATLWELLTLRPIFNLGDDSATPDLVLKIQSADPGSPRKHNKYVPRDLEAIVLKCLEKDRTRRYPTADQLADDLGKFLSGEPVAAQPPSLGYLASKFVRRYRSRLALAGVVLVAVLASVVAAFVAILASNEELTDQRYDNHIAVAERELTQDHDIGLADSLLQDTQEQRRGWEWRYLVRLLDGGRPPLEGHKSALWGAEFSPDGQSVATVSIDGTLKIWDAATGRLRPDGDIEADRISFFDLPLSRWLSSLGISRIPITCLAFSPDGKSIATGSFAPPLNPKPTTQDLLESRGLVRIWDAETGRMKDSFENEEQRGVILSLTYSPDGRRIASSSIDPENAFVVRNVNGGKVVQVERGKSHVHRLRYSPDGRLLAAAETDGVVKLWDTATFKLVRSIAAHPAPVVGVSFEPPDGPRFATAGEDGTLRIWETATGRMVIELKGHTGSALDVRYSPDGKRIASAGFDKTVRVWDPLSGKLKITLRGHTDTVWSVAFSPDGQQLVSAGFDKTARIWDSTPHEDRKGPGLFTVAVTDDRRVSGGAFSSLDPRSAEVESTRSDDHRVNSVAFSSDGRYLASGGWDKDVRLLEGETGKEIAAFKGHSLVVWCVAFSPDGKRLASASWDHTVKVWDRESGRELLTFDRHTAPVHGVAFSPDGRRLVSGGFDGQVKVWDAATGAVTAHCDGFVFPILAVAFSPDGKHVASGGGDRSVKVWDAGRGAKPLLTLKGHQAAVHGLSFSPDGKRLASASWDKTLRIWDVDLDAKVADDARELRVLKGKDLKDKPLDRAHGVSFSPDGLRVASASEDKTVRVWDARTGEEVVPLRRHHRGVVWSVAFSPDGKRLAAGCWANSSLVKTWDAGRE